MSLGPKTKTQLAEKPIVGASRKAGLKLEELQNKVKIRRMIRTATHPGVKVNLGN